MRKRDQDDPEHGKRAAELAKSLNGIAFSSNQVKLLYQIISSHNEGYISYDQTIGVCWDSDRLDLWRCGIEPRAELLSTNLARSADYIRWAKEIHLSRYTWDDIIIQYEKMCSYAKIIRDNIRQAERL